MKDRRVNLEDLARLNSIPTPAPGPPHSWEPQSLVIRDANPPEPPTIGGVLYPCTRVLLSGETECLKTWFAAILAKAEMDIGLPVAWVDLDAMGPGEILSRLRALGVSDDITHELFLYYEPEQRLAGDVLEEVCGDDRGAWDPAPRDRRVQLHAAPPRSRSERDRGHRNVLAEVADAITRAGAAPPLLDHVVKSADNRGKYAIGSERKASGAIVHLGLRLIETFARGGTGRALISTHKDRPGFHRRPTLGKLVLVSDGSNVPTRSKRT